MLSMDAQRTLTRSGNDPLRSVRPPAIWTLLVAGLFCLIGAQVAQAAKSASLVIDANTGRTLHDRDADELRYPASLTKMMTVYLVFEEIEAGRLSYGTRITASARAAGRSPSKIGLRVGEQISVRTAVEALIVKSANDVATAVAEHISGSEWRFARRMTAKARQLGMANTVFRNASGLPNSEQVTTARDIVKLALALQDHFPQHYHHFKKTRFRYRGRTIRGHNAITRSFPGAEGLKTGYIRASGFNIVSAVRRGRKHVVAAVFGGRTGRARNRLTRILLSRGLARASRRRTRVPKIPTQKTPLLVAKRKRPAAKRVARAVTPQLRRPRLIGWGRTQVTQRVARRPVLQSRHQSESRNTQRAVPAPVSPTVTLARVRVGSILPQRSGSEARDVTRQPAGTMPTKRDDAPGKPRTITDLIARLAQPGLAAAQQPIPPKPQPAYAPPADDKLGQLLKRISPTVMSWKSQSSIGQSHPPERRKAGGGRDRFQIQVGAYVSQDEGMRKLARVRAEHASLIGDAADALPTVEAGGKTLYRARFAGFDAASASGACDALRAQGIDCHVAIAR